MDIERRIFSGSLEVRAVKGADTVRGYAAKFGVLSENLGGFVEQIARGAFDDVLGDDVRALINHDPNLVLGRTVSGTLRVGVDDVGLFYEADLPATQYARDLVEVAKRGDVSQSSFQFRVAPGGDDWTEDDSGRIVRTLKKLGRLYDVSAVTFPAYPDATAAVRNLEQFKAERDAAKREAERLAGEAAAAVAAADAGAAARAAGEFRKRDRRRRLARLHEIGRPIG